MHLRQNKSNGLHHYREVHGCILYPTLAIPPCLRALALDYTVHNYNKFSFCDVPVHMHVCGFWLL